MNDVQTGSRGRPIANAARYFGRRLLEFAEDVQADLSPASHDIRTWRVTDSQSDAHSLRAYVALATPWTTLAQANAQRTIAQRELGKAMNLDEQEDALITGAGRHVDAAMATGREQIAVINEWNAGQTFGAKGKAASSGFETA